MENKQEREILKIDFLKITEEDKPMKEDFVMINNVRTKLGPGFIRILRLYKTKFDKSETELLRVTFFTKTLEDNEEYRKYKKMYLKILCKALSAPLEKLTNLINSNDNVAVQAEG